MGAVVAELSEVSGASRVNLEGRLPGFGLRGLWGGRSGGEEGGKVVDHADSICRSVTDGVTSSAFRAAFVAVRHRLGLVSVDRSPGGPTLSRAASREDEARRRPYLSLAGVTRIVARMPRKRPQPL